MKLTHLVTLSAALLLSGQAFADAGADLFKKHSCGTCHQMDKKVVGPAVKAIAAKYAGNAGAQATLQTKVRTGGSGSFGTMPMPKTSANVSDADIATMVTWILASK
jgi:cytochrome c